MEKEIDKALESKAFHRKFFVVGFAIEMGRGGGRQEEEKFQIATLSKRVKGNRWPWRMQTQSSEEKAYIDRSCCFLFKHERSGMES